ncbi:MAG TPA: phosphate/phosphite/phosphonate ABC transporter substrate-binding protein [Bryobacteraceae bacterium]|nr:phosphate/phosphite/phosphonate ABC transporter substrate-binding protein [Bryobacteraceae bacterium]
MTKLISSRRTFLTAATGAISAASALSLRAGGGIKVGMIPDAGATQVSIEEKAPLRNYLSKAIGAQVDLIIPTNYNATVEALGNGSLDFAYLGALTYVKAHDRYGVLPLVQRSADKNFHSLFITQSGSAIHKLADCKGKRFAFGDINSTSGHLIPYDELKKAGVNPDRDMQIRYTGSHAATAKAVEGAASDAGALDETVYRSMVSEGKVDGSKVRIFFTSPPFVDYVWVARKDIGASQRERFANAFLSLKEGKDDAILNILRGKDFVHANDAEYANIRKIARDLKML